MPFTVMCIMHWRTKNLKCHIFCYTQQQNTCTFNSGQNNYVYVIICTKFNVECTHLFLCWFAKQFKINFVPFSWLDILEGNASNLLYCLLVPIVHTQTYMYKTKQKKKKIQSKKVCACCWQHVLCLSQALV